MGLDLITKAEYKAYVGISSTTQDAIISSLITKVSALVKSVCRRTFVDYLSDPKVEYFQESGDTYIVGETPVLSIQSLEYSADYGQSYTALTEYTDYVLNKRDDTVKCLTGDFVDVVNSYRLTYTAGYEELPEDLKLAIFDTITYYLRNDGAVHSNKAPGTNTVQVEYITTTSLPAHIRRVLDLYTQSYA